MFDTHIHLDQYDWSKLSTLIAHWQEQGIQHVVAVATNLSSSYRTLELHHRFPEFVFPALGYHPEQPPIGEQEKRELFSLIKKEHQQIAAVGEVGLPHYTKEKLSASQLELVEEQFFEWVELANEVSLPLNIHAVHDSTERALELVGKCPNQRAHFHWLKAPFEIRQKVIKSGHFVSVTPEVCYRTRDQQLVREVPLTQLLVETDGPWPFDGPFKGKQTTPLLVKEIVKTIAWIKGLSKAEVEKQTLENAYRLYKR